MGIVTLFVARVLATCHKGPVSWGVGEVRRQREKPRNSRPPSLSRNDAFSPFGPANDGSAQYVDPGLYSISITGVEQPEINRTWWLELHVPRGERNIVLSPA